jgi:GT2 family glycosyltransferase
MFSIIIPTWNNLPFLQLAVDTIRRHSAHDHEILVHVNDGSDGTLEWVRREGILHTASPGNIGICFAVNRVAALATRPYLLYLNDDMAVLPGWDARLLEVAQRLDGQRFMLSSTMVEPDSGGNRCSVAAAAALDVDRGWRLQHRAVARHEQRQRPVDEALARRLPHLRRPGRQLRLPLRLRVDQPHREERRPPAVSAQVGHQPARLRPDLPAPR